MGVKQKHIYIYICIYIYERKKESKKEVLRALEVLYLVNSNVPAEAVSESSSVRKHP